MIPVCRAGPTLLSLAANAFHEQKAEVVFCVSNLVGTQSNCERLPPSKAFQHLVPFGMLEQKL